MAKKAVLPTLTDGQVRTLAKGYNLLIDDSSEQENCSFHGAEPFFKGFCIVCILVSEVIRARPHRTGGQVAYEAYCANSKGKSLVSGELLPKWGELKKEIHNAWEAAAAAAARW